MRESASPVLGEPPQDGLEGPVEPWRLDKRGADAKGTPDGGLFGDSHALHHKKMLFPTMQLPFTLICLGMIDLVHFQEAPRCLRAVPRPRLTQPPKNAQAVRPRTAANGSGPSCGEGLGTGNDRKHASR